MWSGAPMSPETSVTPNGERDTADAFLLQYRHLVRYVVDRLRASVVGVFDDDDAMQAGLLALMAAREAYRDDRGASFETYAILRIRGAILDAVRALDPVSRGSRDAGRTIANASVALAASLAREPTDAELADALGLPLERCVELRRSADVTTVSMDAMKADDTADQSCLADAIADPCAIDPVDRATQNEELASLLSEVARLGERNRRVIALYYRDELTFREIAGVLGVSESRACQIHRSALQRLRERLMGAGTATSRPVLTPG
jgi:RNA polymerase sigma factor FliA